MEIEKITKSHTGGTCYSYRCVGAFSAPFHQRQDGQKLGGENIIRIARMFNVSADFLLGEAKFQVI